MNILIINNSKYLGLGDFINMLLFYFFILNLILIIIYIFMKFVKIKGTLNFIKNILVIYLLI